MQPCNNHPPLSNCTCSVAAKLVNPESERQADCALLVHAALLDSLCSTLFVQPCLHCSADDRRMEWLSVCMYIGIRLCALMPVHSYPYVCTDARTFISVCVH